MAIGPSLLVDCILMIRWVWVSMKVVVLRLTSNLSVENQEFCCTILWTGRDKFSICLLWWLTGAQDEQWHPKGLRLTAHSSQSQPGTSVWLIFVHRSTPYCLTLAQWLNRALLRIVNDRIISFCTFNNSFFANRIGPIGQKLVEWHLIRVVWLHTQQQPVCIFQLVSFPFLLRERSMIPIPFSLGVTAGWRRSF